MKRLLSIIICFVMFFSVCGQKNVCAAKQFLKPAFNNGGLMSLEIGDFSYYYIDQDSEVFPNQQNNTLIRFDYNSGERLILAEDVVDFISDGKIIYYVSGVEHSNQIWRVNCDGTSKEQIHMFSSKSIQSIMRLENDDSLILKMSDTSEHILNVTSANVSSPNSNNIIEEMRNSYIGYLQYLNANRSEEAKTYSIYDINKDSIPELIVKKGTCEADYSFDVFSYIENKPTFIGRLPGGHISLCSVTENGILLYLAHMGYEMVFEGIMNKNQITYNLVYEEDCTQKEYKFDGKIDKFRPGAKYLEVCRDISDYTLLNNYFDSMTLEQKITVILDKKELSFDQPPIIVDGRTLVPLRAIFEAMGATVDWDGNTQTVTSTKGQTTISMSIGKKEMYKNGKLIMLDVAPQVIGERTLVPVRAVAEGFDCKVDWDGNTKTVIIKTIDTEKIINIAKNLYRANEDMGGVTNLATYAEVDELLYNTLNELDVATEYKATTLDIVSTSTAIAVNGALASKGDFSAAGSIGKELASMLNSSEVADVIDGSAKDVVKGEILKKIDTMVPDINAFILGLGRTAYDRNAQMILELMVLHEKIGSNNYTYEDVVAYIVIYDTLMLNRKTMSMAVQVLSDELPDGFLESLAMTTQSAVISALKTVIGSTISGRGINVGAELFTDIATAYADYVCGMGEDFIKYMKQVNHPAITEWANEVSTYEKNLAEKLSAN